MAFSFEEYKDRVPIVQVAEALGYILNKAAGRNPLEYKHPDHHTIVISNPKGRQRYFTRHETDNKGSVVDFVKHRLTLFNEYYNREAEGINKVLASFAGVSNTIPKTPVVLVQNEKKYFNLNDYKVSKPQAHDLLYLSGKRGLSVSTIQTFLPHIRLVQPTYSKSCMVHIGFPYHIPGRAGQGQKEPWVGFELINYLFKGHARGSDKSNGLWIADLPGMGGNTKNAYVAESAIDAMSFYQLFKQKFRLDESVFLSTGGYVTDKQIRNMLNAYPQTMIHTIFDNDLSGHLYDIRTACMKDNKILQIRKNGNKLYFDLDKQSIVLKEHLVSLTNFRKESGLRPEIRVHKPNEKDFNEMLVQRDSFDRKGSFKMT